MLFTYLTINDEMVAVDRFEKGCWINLIRPTEEELNLVASQTGVLMDFLRYPLDDEEIPRLEIEDGQILIIMNIPIIRPKDVIYDTLPLGIILADEYIITVCLEDFNNMLQLTNTKIKGLATFKRTRFFLTILYKNAQLYLRYLREIDKKTNEIELTLHQSMKNRELIKLLNLEKSLVYFTTSLRSNEKVLERILKSKTIKMYEEDEDILEDVIIENKQAIEMADIYTNILTSTMGAFASIISNNLNIVMKFLASITIVVALPTMVASFFGMNVGLPFQESPLGFVIVVSIAAFLSLCSVWYLSKRDMF